MNVSRPNAGYCAGRDNELKRFKKGKQFSKCCKFSVLGDKFCLGCPSCTLAMHSLGGATTASVWRRGKVLECASGSLSPLSYSFYQRESGLPLMVTERIFFHLHLSWAGESSPLPLCGRVWCPGFDSSGVALQMLNFFRFTPLEVTVFSFLTPVRHPDWDGKHSERLF